MRYSIFVVLMLSIGAFSLNLKSLSEEKLQKEYNNAVTPLQQYLDEMLTTQKKCKDQSCFGDIQVFVDAMTASIDEVNESFLQISNKQKKGSSTPANDTLSKDEAKLEQDLEEANQQLASCDEEDIKCKTINQVKIDVLKKSTDTIKKLVGMAF